MSRNCDIEYHRLSEDAEEGNEDNMRKGNSAVIIGPVICRFGGIFRIIGNTLHGCIPALGFVNWVNRKLVSTPLWYYVRFFLGRFWFPLCKIFFAFLCIDVEFQGIRNGEEGEQESDLTGVTIHSGNNHQNEQIIRLEEERARLQNQLFLINEEKEGLKKEVSRLEIRNAEILREKQAALKEKEAALTRLSEMAGAKLKYNNPGITDLSDDNRPSKLAEKFSELYDNEWTDAYSELETKNKEMKEKEIIERLCLVLKHVYEKCFEMAEKQRRSLTQNLTNLTASDKDSASSNTSPESHILKKISDLQKDVALPLIPSVIETLHSDFVKEFTGDMTSCNAYIKKCIILCWMMCVQEPPVHLDFNCTFNATLDPNIFRHYTKNGTVIDYLVWPAMLLHQGGPLLHKGVCQPQ